MTPFTSIPPAIEDLLEKVTTPSRRDFLRASGVLVVSAIASTGGLKASGYQAAQACGGRARSRAISGS